MMGVTLERWTGISEMLAAGHPKQEAGERIDCRICSMETQARRDVASLGQEVLWCSVFRVEDDSGAVRGTPRVPTYGKKLVALQSLELGIPA